MISFLAFFIGFGLGFLAFMLTNKYKQLNEELKTELNRLTCEIIKIKSELKEEREKNESRENIDVVCRKPGRPKGSGRKAKS